MPFCKFAEGHFLSDCINKKTAFCYEMYELPKNKENNKQKKSKYKKTIEIGGGNDKIYLYV